MKAAGLKYIFYAGSLVLLVAMLLLSRNAGISCDEVLHYDHSLEVYDYFASGGSDRSSLDTPESHLKYYGQSYDNFVTILAKWFRIDDVYTFRHYMSSLAGWLAVVVTALFAVWLSGYGTGLIVLFLFAVSPTFMGHAQNNLKDIPFALSYIAGLYFMMKVLFGERSFRPPDVALLILSIAFSISIRAGGLLLICYLYLFLLVSVFYDRYNSGRIDYRAASYGLIIITLASGAAYFTGILLWPYALEAPLVNVLDSYRVMAHFSATFRQIFEGKVIWSDMMPWYYLTKSMLITIPLIVSAGFLIFLLMVKKAILSKKILHYLLILFAIFFPVFFVLLEKSNLYSSWRQFLFVYPPLILLAATGISFFISWLKGRIIKILLAAALIIASLHPLLFMARNPVYSYIYYNQLAGGLSGAHGNYETDYYYVAQTEASEWLKEYFTENDIHNADVAATFSVKWHFRDMKGVTTKYIRNEERSMHDWDYAIITNRYIPPFRLKEKKWPPADAIHVVYADDVPLCAVLKRETKDDYQGYRALKEGRSDEAVVLLANAVKVCDEDEMIFYNFACALYDQGNHAGADSVLKAGLEINPDFEPILMYLGNIAAHRGDTLTALQYYERLTGVNIKYFDAWVEAARVAAPSDVKRARKYLRQCLGVNPGYVPAIRALADTYRDTDPDIAEKLDDTALIYEQKSNKNKLK
ncbi:MAG: hypothetical protein JXR66_06360 [Bacteroidales bacterium]|nr:hypothetical protein [Bacteroidales bacterium]MBN2633159.1 hypothetical protein [Bacteroidales bacterium]